MGTYTAARGGCRIAEVQAVEQTVDKAGSTMTDDGSRADAAGTPVSPPKPKPQRALTADFVRVLLFTGVVIAHSVNAVNTTPDVVRSAGMVGTMLHLTRYGFVAVTLFVLVLSMRGKSMSPMTFWRRRFGLIVLPYLVWTLVYSITDHLIIQNHPFPSVGIYFHDLGLKALTGDAKYQLYFLLISMQIYLVFPLLKKVLDRTADRPWRVLAAGFTIQMTMFVIYQYLPRPEGTFWYYVYEHMWKSLPMYALFVAIGALAAYHHKAMEQWLRSNVVLVVGVCGIACAFSIGAYLAATAPGDVPLNATTPWNPVQLPWLVGALVLLWLGAMAWDDMRAAGKRVGARAVSWATTRAFGVFAVHPLLLDGMARLGFFDDLNQWFPNSAAVRSTILVALTLTLSLIIVDLLLRIPRISRWFVARDRIPFPKLRTTKPVPESVQVPADDQIRSNQLT